MTDEEIEALNDRELIHFIWDVFGVAIDYGTTRKEILKQLRRLSS